MTDNNPLKAPPPQFLPSPRAVAITSAKFGYRELHEIRKAISDAQRALHVELQGDRRPEVISRLSRIINQGTRSTRVIQDEMKAAQPRSLGKPKTPLTEIYGPIAIAGAGYQYATTRIPPQTILANAVATYPALEAIVLLEQNFRQPPEFVLDSSGPDITMDVIPGRGVQYSPALRLSTKDAPSERLERIVLFSEFPAPELRFLGIVLIARSDNPQQIDAASLGIQTQHGRFMHTPAILHHVTTYRSPFAVCAATGWETIEMQEWAEAFSKQWGINAFTVDLVRREYLEVYIGNKCLTPSKVGYMYTEQEFTRPTLWHFTLDFTPREHHIVEIDSVLIVNYGEQLPWLEHLPKLQER